MSAKFPTAKLTDIAELNPTLGKKLPAEELVSFVPMASLSAESASVETTQDRPYAEVAKGFTPFLDGDVLVAKITPCFENGKIAQARLPRSHGFGSTEFHVVRARSGITESRYLHHYLRLEEVRANGQRRMTGSGGQRRVPAGFLADLAVPLPPLEEQRRIAAILDQTETLRTQRRTALALLDSLTQSLFLDMFGDPATNSRKWPVKRLKDLGQVITGGTPPSSKEGMFDGPIPFITPGDLESEEPVRRSVTEAGAKEVNVVRAGATLVCCIGATIGKVGIAQKDSAFNQQLNAVVWGNHISDNYGYEVMRFFKPTIISWGASTTLPILKKSSFEQIEIPVPPVPLQELFTDRLKHISNLKGLHKSALLGFDNLFNALQSRAFAGEP